MTTRETFTRTPHTLVHLVEFHGPGRYEPGLVRDDSLADAEGQWPVFTAVAEADAQLKADTLNRLYGVHGFVYRVVSECAESCKRCELDVADRYFALVERGEVR